MEKDGMDKGFVPGPEPFMRGEGFGVYAGALSVKGCVPIDWDRAVYPTVTQPCS